MGVKVGEETLYTLQFEDDQMLIAEDEEDLTYMLRKLLAAYSEWGLEVNKSKTQYMVVGGSSPTSLNVDDWQLHPCSEFKYLGAWISATGSSELDIQKKIVKGKLAIQLLNSVLWSKSIRMEIKKRLFHVFLANITLYAAETWSLTKKMEDRLLALEMDFWRRSCGVSKIWHVPNPEIRRRVGIQKNILYSIEKNGNENGTAT
ncbi:uncharacterized protein [Rhodnius prolixus]|uniref:uncharacterized protein n=1 Tax=Rhodnius prolixus TaxID=13249 RepID=UPI003D1881AE